MATRNGTKVANLLEDQISNDAEEAIMFQAPYTVEVTLVGEAPIIFHRWSVEDVEEKGKAAKGSQAKKTDNVESYVWRNEKQEICIPGEYLRQTLINAAKFKQDPRSPRKSAMDITKAALIPTTELAPIIPVDKTKPTKDWDYLDRRHVTIQRAGITRSRPAFAKGWHATFQIQVILPEYIDMPFLRELLAQGGRVIGLADFRPTYGRYSVESIKKIL